MDKVADLLKSVIRIVKSKRSVGALIPKNKDNLIYFEEYDEDSPAPGTIKWVAKFTESKFRYHRMLKNLPCINVLQLIGFNDWILYEYIETDAVADMITCIKAAQQFSSYFFDVKTASWWENWTYLSTFLEIDRTVFDDPSLPAHIKKRSKYWYSKKFAKLYNSLVKRTIHGKLTYPHVLKRGEEIFMISFDDVREDVLILEVAAIFAYSFLDDYLASNVETLIKEHFPYFKESEIQHIHLFVEFALYYLLQDALRVENTEFVQIMIEQLAKF